MNEAREEFRRLCEMLDGKAGQALEILEAGLKDAIQVFVLPLKYQRRLKSTNMPERLLEEVHPDLPEATLVVATPGCAAGRAARGVVHAKVTQHGRLVGVESG